jgi:hypothetical protein
MQSSTAPSGVRAARPVGGMLVLHKPLADGFDAVINATAEPHIGWGPGAIGDRAGRCDGLRPATLRIPLRECSRRGN